MAAAATFSLASQLARDPRVRQIAKNVGRKSVRAIGNSRNRRAKRGQWYAGKRVGIPPSMNVQRGTIASVQTMPAAYNPAITTNSSRPTRFVKREATGIGALKCEPGDNGELYFYNVTPMDSELFPILSKSAINYTQYRFSNLVIEYVPRAGTTAEGNVYMGWRPQSTSHQADFPTVEVISSLPCNVQSTIRQGCRLRIPTNPKPKYVAVPSGNTFDPLNYYWGTFVIALQGDEKDDVGSLWVSYTVDLIQPKLNTSPSHSFGDLVTGTFSGGPLSLRGTDTPFHFTYSAMHPTHIMVMTENPSYGLYKNGVGVPTLKYVAGTSLRWGIHEMPSSRRRDIYSIVVGDETLPTSVWIF